MTTPDTRTAMTLTQLQPTFAAAVRAVLADLAAEGIEMVAYDGYRTISQQRRLYEQGRIRPGAVVTQCDGSRKRSRHQDGAAVDCAFLVRLDDEGWRLSWSGPWDRYGAVAEQHGLVWGGRWAKFPDRPHVEAAR